MKLLFAALAFTLLLSSTSNARAQAAGYNGLGAESVAPELIAKYAPHALEPTLSRHIQSMFDIRSPGLGVLAPDGRQLFFSWGITGTRQLFRLSTPLGFPAQLTGGEDNTAVYDVTPDGKWLIVARDVGGQENPGLYLQSTQGGPLKLVQKIEKVQTQYAFVTEDSQEIFFQANDIEPDSYAIYRYSIATGKRNLVFSEKGLWSVADHIGHGAGLRLLLSKATGSTSMEYAEYVPATKTLTPLFGANESSEYNALYAAQSNELLVLTNKFNDFRRLYRWKIGSAPTEANFHAVLAPEGMDVSGITLDPKRQHLYATLNDGGYTRLKILNAATFAPEVIPIPKDADQAYPGSVTADGRFAIIGIEKANAPRTSYVWDWKVKKLTQWVKPSAPEVDLSSFVPVRLTTYPAKDGTRIPMFVRIPKGCATTENTGADPCPVVVEFHGGPEGQARPGFSPYAQLFVDAGFIFVEPNVRGSDGYGKKWLDADNGAKRLDVITDIDDLGQWLRANWQRNGKVPRLGVTGGSYGGYCTLVAMTMFAGTYDAGASVVGISNLVTFLRNTAPYRRILRTTEYGDPDKDLDALVKLSPVTYIDRVKGPLLVIQGVNDPRVPVGEAIQVHDLLEKQGIASPLILFADEGHGASKRGNAVLETGYVIQFLKDKLMEVPPSTAR